MARSGSFMSTVWLIHRQPGSPFRTDRPITLVVKCVGTRSAGNPHATCDAAGAGNGGPGTSLIYRASSRPYQPFI